MNGPSASALRLAAEPEIADAGPWRDRQGDVWTLGADGLLHTPETAPFPREHVERKWGPLRPEPAEPEPKVEEECLVMFCRRRATHVSPGGFLWCADHARPDSSPAEPERGDTGYQHGYGHANDPGQQEPGA